MKEVGSDVSLPEWELAPFEFSLNWIYDPEFGWLEFYFFPESHKDSDVMKLKPEDVTLTGCRGHCLYPSDFRCRNLPCFEKLMARSDLD